jgi:hypothetical protein
MANSQKKTKKQPPKTTSVAHNVKAAKKEDVTSSKKTSEPKSSPFTSLSTLTPAQRAVALGVIALGILAVAGYMFYRNFLVAAYVNKQPISRLEVIKQLEKQSGKQVLNQLIVQKLIEQEAKKRNITVSDAEVNKELKTLEDTVKKQGMTLTQALQSQGMSLQQLKDQVKLELALRKMVKTSAVTDKDVADYVEANKDNFTEEQQSAAGFSSQIKDQLAQERQQSSVQKFVQDLQKKASITPVVQY